MPAHYYCHDGSHCCDLSKAAAASDDQLGLAKDSVEIYSDWLKAKKPVELHILI
jgi:hypothetical protein